MTSNRPFISILTPTHNRADFLPKLLNSLRAQTFKDFEWVIANDGSIDESHVLIKSYMQSENFKITYIHSSLRVGKSKMDNLLLDNLNGKYIFWCDSDDYLTNNALEIIKNKIISLARYENDDDFIGLFGINNGTDGELQTHFHNNFIPSEGEYLWQDLEKNVSGDGTIIVNSKLFEGKRFPEIDFLTIESVLLRDLYFNKKIYFIHDILKIMDRSAENSITHGKKMQYCKGSSYAIAKTISHKRYKDLSLKNKLKTLINYIRYSFHGDISISNQVRDWEIARIFFPLFVLLLPAGFLLSYRDIYLGKVEKTHILFEENISKTKINIKVNF